MEAINKRNSKEPTSGPTCSSSSKTSQEDEALSRLLAKDPVLGEVMKTLFGKLDETKKRLDDLLGERRRDLDVCHDQVDPLLDAEVRVVKEHKGMKLETVPPIMQVQAQLKTEPEPLCGTDSGKEAVEACLGLPKILRRILEYVSSQELIKLSLVNKSWNFEARSLLRDRGCLRGRINSRPACQGLLNFAADLQQMRVVPFTGINVSINHFECKPLSSESLNPSYQVILDRLPWKCLSVVFDGHLSNLKNCPAFLLVKGILEDYCWVLEDVQVASNRSDCQLIEFFQGIFQSQNFPVLKILKFTRPAFYVRRDSPYTPAFIKTILTGAPNLKQLCIDGPIRFKENVMEGSSGVIFATSGLWPLRDRFCESLIGALRTETINMFCEEISENFGKHVKAEWEYFDVELLNRIVPLVIVASHIELKTLWMDLLFAVPLMCYRIELENVTELGICVNESTVKGTEPDILAIVKGFDFTRVFPNLEKVQIRDYGYRAFLSDEISAFVERGKAVARKASPDRAIYITHLELDIYQQGSTPPLIFLSQMFPQVKTLSVKTNALQEFPFTLLWEHFSCLTELHVDFHAFDAPITINLDSVFCGLFPEEVAELRAKDGEYLKAANIVPVMPSIAGMKGLRLLTLRYQLSSSSIEDSTRMFSKVTGLIGFSRCSALSVKFKTVTAPKSLDHMKPYVTAITED